MEVQREVMKRFLALKDLCVNPNTGQPYILSLVAGTANSPEGFDEKLTQVWNSAQNIFKYNLDNFKYYFCNHIIRAILLPSVVYLIATTTLDNRSLHRSTLSTTHSRSF